MNALATQTLVLQALSDFGFALLAILGIVLTIGVGMLVFRAGSRAVGIESGDSRTGRQILDDDVAAFIAGERKKKRRIV